MPHKYDFIVECFAKAFDEINRLDMVDIVAKGGVGEILLAHFLNHEIVPNDKGADGFDENNRKYEYKVSVTDQFNFHFGTRSCKSGETPQIKVKKHFKNIFGTYCAMRQGANITKLIYLPKKELVQYLCDHFDKTDGQQLNKNFNFHKLCTIKNSKVLKG